MSRLHELHEAGVSWEEIALLLGIGGASVQRYALSERVPPGVQQKIDLLYARLVADRPDLSILKRRDWIRTRDASGLSPLENAQIELQKGTAIRAARSWQAPRS